jgi:membrane protein implicated in regulation of membrane protease activity
MAYLVMAGFWFVVGILVLVWDMLHPEARILVIRGTRISYSWVALLMSVYALVRWWSRRSFRHYRDALERAQSERDRHDHREPNSLERDPDPNFNFTAEPPPRP